MTKTLHHWVVVSIACLNCGQAMSLRMLDHKPTQPETDENEASIGKMFCIRTEVAQLTINQEPIIRTLDD